MSAYVKVELDIQDEEALVEALVEMGFRREDMIFQPGRHLEGYHGDRRAQTADISIPRRVVGVGANDIGFRRRPDGKFDLELSENEVWVYRARWPQHGGFTGKLKHHYGVRVATKQLVKKGYRVTQARQPGGAVVLQATRWR